MENDVELYKKICELKVGDIVKTYKHGYKNIKLINSFKYNPAYTKRSKRLYINERSRCDCYWKAWISS